MTNVDHTLPSAEFNRAALAASRAHRAQVIVGRQLATMLRAHDFSESAIGELLEIHFSGASNDAR